MAAGILLFVISSTDLISSFDDRRNTFLAALACFFLRLIYLQSGLIAGRCLIVADRSDAVKACGKNVA